MVPEHSVIDLHGHGYSPKAEERIVHHLEVARSEAIARLGEKTYQYNQEQMACHILKFTNIARVWPNWIAWDRYAGDQPIAF
jgi:hypothetical protein